MSLRTSGWARRILSNCERAANERSVGLRRHDGIEHLVLRSVWHADRVGRPFSAKPPRISIRSVTYNRINTVFSETI